MKNVVVIDYGLGNVRSVAGAIEKIGHNALVTNKFEEMESADKLILPGVGAFGEGMANLRKLDLVKPLTDLVISNLKPILGICLGFQLFGKESSEFGHNVGLGWIDASMVPLQPGSGLRLPHVGWNETVQKSESLLFDNLPDSALFYYVHNFQVVCDNPSQIVATCEYGSTFTAAFQRDNIYGTQFHPEKSQLNGLGLIRNFVEKTDIDA